MSLLRPKVGEVLDRLTIVAMKRIPDIEARGALENEWQELKEWLCGNLGEEQALLAARVAELAALNAFIWNLVEQANREGDPRQALNRARAELIKGLGGDDVKV